MPTAQADSYVPPKPHSLAALPALLRVLWNGDGNLLELLPAAAYRFARDHLFTVDHRLRISFARFCATRTACSRRAT